MSALGRGRRAALIAWFASLTVAVLVSAPLLAIFHQISVRHEVCEHGELVESGPAPLNAMTASWAERTAERARGPAVRGESEEIIHGHDHCSLGTLAKNSVGTVNGVAWLDFSSTSTFSRSFARKLFTVRDLLFNAPKTSPPAMLGSVSA
jgi:hypothetical protein